MHLPLALIRVRLYPWDYIPIPDTRTLPLLVSAIALCPWREPGRNILCCPRPASDRTQQAMLNGQTLRSGRVMGIGESTVSQRYRNAKGTDVCGETALVD